MTKALIVVDVQNDFISGSLAVPDGEKTAQRIAGLLAVPDQYDIVVFTQDWHLDPGEHWSETPDFKDTWPKHAEAFSWGAQLHDAIYAPSGVRVATFHKGMYSAAYSGFEGTENEYGSPLADWLRSFEVTEVDIVGIATDYCVKATALDAVKEGFKTRVLLFYTAAVTPDGEVNAVVELQEAGVAVA